MSMHVDLCRLDHSPDQCVTVNDPVVFFEPPYALGVIGCWIECNDIMKNRQQRKEYVLCRLFMERLAVHIVQFLIEYA